MSRAEALVLIEQLHQLEEDVRDLRWNEETPQHVAIASVVHVKYITEAIAELAHLHGVSA